MDDPAPTLRRHWNLEPTRVEPLAGGMNSRTWLVEAGGARLVAKQVDAAGATALADGARAAAALAAAGLRTGPPRPTADGDLVVEQQAAEGWALVLLEHVEGRELDGETEEDRRLMARTLGAVHAAGGPAPGPGTTGFYDDWLPAARPGWPSWLADVVPAVRAGTDALPLTWSVLHTDPAPEAFIDDRPGGEPGGADAPVALVDWAGSRRGPVLYDVASAVMYLGGPAHEAPFLGTYAAAGPLPASELRHVGALLRFRWCVQGAYFADRLARRDLTGLDDDAGNEQGLADARAGLAAAGVPVD